MCPMFFWSAALPLIAVLQAIAGAIAFFFQGGFGGGHGKFDQFIFFVEMPGIWIVMHVPDRYLSGLSDFQSIILAPLLVNLTIYIVAGWCLDILGAILGTIKRNL